MKYIRKKYTDLEKNRNQIVCRLLNQKYSMIQTNNLFFTIDLFFNNDKRIPTKFMKKIKTINDKWQFFVKDKDRNYSNYKGKEKAQGYKTTQNFKRFLSLYLLEIEKIKIQISNEDIFISKPLLNDEELCKIIGKIKCITNNSYILEYKETQNFGGRKYTTFTSLPKSIKKKTDTFFEIDIRAAGWSIFSQIFNQITEKGFYPKIENDYEAYNARCLREFLRVGNNPELRKEYKVFLENKSKFNSMLYGGFVKEHKELMRGSKIVRDTILDWYDTLDNDNELKKYVELQNKNKKMSKIFFIYDFFEGIIRNAMKKYFLQKCYKVRDSHDAIFINRFFNDIRDLTIFIEDETSFRVYF